MDIRSDGYTLTSEGLRSLLLVILAELGWGSERQPDGSVLVAYGAGDGEPLHVSVIAENDTSYLDVTFPQEASTQALVLLDEVRANFRQRLPEEQ
jgi:hypothetical protein